MSDSLAPATRMGAVHLTVHDLPAQLEFYTRALGLRPRAREHAATGLGAGGEDLLVLHPAPGARPERHATGLYHFALLLPSRAALGRALRHLLATRTPLQGSSDHAVSEAVYLADTEGNGIEIYRDRPRAEWPFPGGKLQMTLDPLDVEGVLAEAGPEGAWSGMESGTRMGHVHLKVRDIEEARAFYCGVLGFDEMQQLGDGALFISAGGYHHHLGANTWHSAGAPPLPAGAVGLRRFEVRVPDAGDVARARERLLAAGIPAADVDGGIVTADPSGIELAILA